MISKQCSAWILFNLEAIKCLKTSTQYWMVKSGRFPSLGHAQVRLFSPSFANVILKQIKHPLSFFVFALPGISRAARVQQAFPDNKPWCSTQRSQPNSEHNQSQKSYAMNYIASSLFLGRLTWMFKKTFLFFATCWTH